MIWPMATWHAPQGVASWVLTLVECGLWLLVLGGSALLARSGLWALRRPPLAPGPTPPPPPSHPVVTVQLPLRNERAVVERLLRAVAALDWPRDRLEVQVLDDSDDDTVEVVDRVAAELRQAGLAIEAVRRDHRRGFKAGALQAALPRARGEFFLLLDADSRPAPDLVRRLLQPLLDDDGLGFAQARWGFENERASLLTRVQALILDGWFVVEQPRTADAGSPVQLNGTSAMVRRAALEQAGGWTREGGDASVTEDLDLSARMLAHGYRGLTLPSITVDTELPDDMAAYRAQQTRWVRGAGEVVRAAVLSGNGGAAGLLGPLARHLRQPAVTTWLVVAPLRAFGLAGPPLVGWGWPAILGILLGAAALQYGATRRRLGRSFLEGVVLAPALVTLQIGMSPALTMALARGLLSRAPGEFVRTPKRGDGTRKGYRARRAPVGLAEALLGALYLALAGRAAVAGDLVGALGLGLFAAAGLLWVGLGSALRKV